MKDEQKLYILLEGSYSDISIVGIFSSDKKREEYKKIQMSDLYEPHFSKEEYFLDELTSFTDAIHNGYFPIWLTITKEGEVNFLKTKARLYDRDKFQWQAKNLKMCLLVKSKSQAIKIANDKRRELLATNKWEI